MQDNTGSSIPTQIRPTICCQFVESGDRPIKEERSPSHRKSRLRLVLRRTNDHHFGKGFWAAKLLDLHLSDRTSSQRPKKGEDERRPCRLIRHNDVDPTFRPSVRPSVRPSINEESGNKRQASRTTAAAAARRRSPISRRAATTELGRSLSLSFKGDIVCV